MKTKFLATTAMVLIGLSGAAWADQTTPAAKPDRSAETTTQEQTLGQTGTDQPLPGEDVGTAEELASDARSDSATDRARTDDTAETATGLAETDDTAEPTPVTAGTDQTTEPATGMTSENGSERLRSYSSTTTTEPFTGSVVGGMSADDLIGMSVVDRDGESVGEVSDLIIGSDDVVQHAIVEVGGFLGFGAKTTAIDLEHATFDQSKGEVTLDISRAEIDAMPEYDRDDDGWFAG